MTTTKNKNKQWKKWIYEKQSKVLLLVLVIIVCLEMIDDEPTEKMHNACQHYIALYVCLNLLLECWFVILRWPKWEGKNKTTTTLNYQNLNWIRWQVTEFLFCKLIATQSKIRNFSSFAHTFTHSRIETRCKSLVFCNFIFQNMLLFFSSSYFKLYCMYVCVYM